jgi:ATP-binding protein involved in chromosome partitioning
LAETAQVTREKVLEALGRVLDPELGKDLVSLKMIKDVRVIGNKVAFTLELTSGACPMKKEIEDAARKAVAAIPGVEEVRVEPTTKAKPEDIFKHRKPIPGVKHTIAVASGKGGVGKSTISVNLALALKKTGAKVGILDIDIYGPSIPKMMGATGPLPATPDERLIPLASHGVKLVSVGFILDEETPLIWRGPLVMQLVQQFLKGVEWTDLDYLVIDLPPGTGDAQLTLVQTIPLSGSVIVTTPQDVALIDARRAIRMFGEVQVPILGIIENMSFFVCPHCGERTEVFSHGGGVMTSEKYNVPFLGKIPLDMEIRKCGDEGRPIVDANPDSPQTKAFIEIAEELAGKLTAPAATT